MPWRIVQGGQGASKNWSIATILLEKASEKRRTITVVSDTFENLKDGIIKDYKDIFAKTKMRFEDYYNAQDKNLYWGESVIQFRYIAGHKPEAGKSKRRDILYVNETTKINYVAAEYYIARTDEICYFDLNPDYETWVHTKILPDEKAERIIVTHWDNEFCPKGERDYIESRKHLTEWYKVYGKGETGTYSERRVYTFNMADKIPEAAKKLPSGMDFGKNPDPTCLVDIYLDGVDIYLDEIFQENDLLPEKIDGAERMSIVDRMIGLDINKNWLICADSSGASEIRDLRKYGFNIRGIGRPKGSQAVGIARLQSYNIYLTKRSLNIKKGMESWLRKVNTKGDIIPEPDGHEPDTLAAARYVMLGKAFW